MDRSEGGNMKYTKIPYVDKPVSRILYGTAAEPFLGGGDGDRLLDQMTELGVTTIDTAQNYAGAEKSIGHWLDKRQNRENVVILSKCGHPDTSNWIPRVNEREMRKDLEGSLADLHTNYIDIYLLHRDDPKTDVQIPVEVFNAMHAEGRIGAFGGSNWDFQRIEAANEYAYKHDMIPFTVSSPNFGLARQVTDLWGGGCVSISGAEGEEARTWYKKNQMPVVAYSSLGRGFFSGKVKSEDQGRVAEILDEFAVKGYVSEDNFERLKRCEELAEEKQATVAQIAMAYIFDSGLNTFAVISTRSVERMQQNIKSLSLELTEEEIAYLELR